MRFLPIRFRWFMWEQLAYLSDWCKEVEIYIDYQTYKPLNLPNKFFWWAAETFFDCTDEELLQLDQEDARNNSTKKEE